MKPIVHDWEGYPERTVREYPFPLSQIATAPDALRLAQIETVVGTTMRSAGISFRKRFDAVQSAKVRDFTSVFDGFVPWSVMISKYHEWIAWKDVTQLETKSENGNVLLVPWRRSQIESVADFDFTNIPWALEFLCEFAGLSLGIVEGCMGVVNPTKFGIATDKHYDYIGSWNGSLPIYLPGNGDVILMNRHGAAGLWEHEWSPTTQGMLKSFFQQYSDRLANLEKKLPGTTDNFHGQIARVESVSDLRCDVVQAVANEITNTLKMLRNG
ncbi:MAG TPA: hypothetical protein DDZ88_17890 [Verrucomicrobiales bacterium]|nr:hypothetical protein [Verrucomicrobiales bacterium]